MKDRGEEKLNKKLEALIKEYGGTGGCVMILQEKDSIDHPGKTEAGMLISMHWPQSRRGFVPEMFRDVAFDLEKRNLMAGIKTEKSESVVTETLSERVERKA